MKINIPCPSCGCQQCEAETKAGQKILLEICRCPDGSGEFEVSIVPFDGTEIQYEKHQCKSEDIETCIASRFNIDLTTIKHECFN